MAFSLDELCELLACARDAGHEVELIHACYGATLDATAGELEAVARALSRR